MSNNLGTGTGGTSPYDDNSDGSSSSTTPIPDFNASNIQLSTVAPAFGIPSSSLPTATRQPDYLDYDQKGRGLVSTMFTNSGISYMLGVTLGGLYGLREGLAKTPSSRWKVKLNSVLNHCGRHGSSLGNMLGATSILYSLYEGLADNVSAIYCVYLYQVSMRMGRYEGDLSIISTLYMSFLSSMETLLVSQPIFSLKQQIYSTITE